MSVRLETFAALFLLICVATTSHAQTANDVRSHSPALEKWKWDDSVSLKLRTERRIFKKGEKVVATVDFIGHPELAGRRNTKKVRLEDWMEDDPVHLQAGFAIELRDEKGNMIHASVKDRRVLRMHFKNIEKGNRYVKLTSGAITTGEFAFSEWFELNPGKYSLKIHYQVADAMAGVIGPMESNTVSFKVL